MQSSARLGLKASRRAMNDPNDAPRKQRRMPRRDEESAKAAATRLVLQRMRGRQEIVKRLTGAGYLPEHAEEAVEMLARNGFIDDAAFARAFIMDKMNLSGHGEVRIRRELRELGVAAADIDHGFALCEAQFEDEGEPRLMRELQNALRALEKCAKAKPLASAADARRVIDQLLRRGFAYAVIREAMKLYQRGVAADED